MVDAYLDIETTGLSPWQSDITVIGIALSDGRETEVVQLLEGTLGRSGLLDAVKAASNLYTYNGSRFDLPFIREKLGVDLSGHLHHRDLMLDCWNRGLYGGLKAVERRLGIPRQLEGMSGLDAVILWKKYKRGDRQALATLLEYNKEDVTNLARLRGVLRGAGER